jgi:hypothetical protein
MTIVIKILKWLNYILIPIAILSFLYITVSKIYMGILIPAYFFVFIFLNLIVITVLNRISNNPTVEIFKDWKWFFVLIFSYFLITLSVAVLT